MTPERYQRVIDLFHAALERAPEARPAFLAQACSGDIELRQDVEAMLAADAKRGDSWTSRSTIWPPRPCAPAITDR
jgi:hypothetical protein